MTPKKKLIASAKLLEMATNGAHINDISKLVSMDFIKFLKNKKFLSYESRGVYKTKSNNLRHLSKLLGFKTTSKCRHCKKTKNKFVYRIKDNNFIYTDERNKRWRFKTCPSCFIEKQMSYKEQIVPLYEYHKNRNCKQCKGQLETSRWWHCFKCKPTLWRDIADEFIYEYTETKPSELPILAGGI